MLAHASQSLRLPPVIDEHIRQGSLNFDAPSPEALELRGRLLQIRTNENLRFRLSYQIRRLQVARAQQ
jgi:hypothetical protein